MSDKAPKSNYERAKERVEEVKAFYKRLASFFSISAFLIVINLLTSDYHWFWFPVLGMSIGVATQYVKTFGIPFTKLLSREWEERKIMEEMYRLEQEEEQVKWLQAKNKPELDLNQEGLELNDIEKIKEEDNRQYKG